MVKNNPIVTYQQIIFYYVNFALFNLGFKEKKSQDIVSSEHIKSQIWLKNEVITYVDKIFIIAFVLMKLKTQNDLNSEN